MQFGEEYRPTKLHRETYGFDAGNEWALGARLDKELYGIIQKHGEGQPVLIFCPTRRCERSRRAPNLSLIPS